MQPVKLGHGNSLPEIGKRFFLKTVLLRSGRVGFSPASLTYGDIIFKVYYSVRSSACIPVLFTEHQIWEVEAVRLRRLLPRNKKAGDFPTMVRLDLYRAYNVFSAYFDPRDKLWRVERLGQGFSIPNQETAAFVRFQRYALHTDNKKEQVFGGFFPEVVEAASERVIVRYSPQTLKLLSSAEIRLTEVLPSDGVPLVTATTVTKAVQFISPI